MLQPHRASDGVSRCQGSGQRIEPDLTDLQWQARVRQTGQRLRRPIRVVSGGLPTLGKRR